MRIKALFHEEGVPPIWVAIECWRCWCRGSAMRSQRFKVTLLLHTHDAEKTVELHQNRILIEGGCPSNGRSISSYESNAEKSPEPSNKKRDSNPNGFGSAGPTGHRPERVQVPRN